MARTISLEKLKKQKTTGTRWKLYRGELGNKHIYVINRMVTVWEKKDNQKLIFNSLLKFENIDDFSEQMPSKFFRVYFTDDFPFEVSDFHRRHETLKSIIDLTRTFELNVVDFYPEYECWDELLDEMKYEELRKRMKSRACY